MVIPIQLSKLKFCRVKFKTKKPFEKDWTNKPYSYEEIQKYFPKENYGVLCGYENLAVIDADHKSLQLAIDTLLPKTFRVKTTKGFHNYFFVPDLKQKIILELGNIHLGEVQSYGTQVVGSGSTHPSGQKYEEANQEEIATLPCEELLDFCNPFRKETLEIEETVKFEKQTGSSAIDDLSVAQIWGTAGLKAKNSEYYGCHPIHGSDGGVNFWINPLKNTWHCFRCNSGGGVLSAIAVKEGIIDCSEARKGALRGDKAIQAIEKAKEKYGLKSEVEKQFPHLEEKKKEVEADDVKIIWEYELENYEIEEKEWIIDKLIPNKAICIITGKRGTLKTFITISMAYAIANGTDFVDTFATRKGCVIYLDKENGISIMKKRTAMLKRGLNFEGKSDIGFICFSQIKLDKLGGIAAIEKVIEEYKPLVLIVDTYRRSVGYDENDAGKVSELFVDTLRPIVEKNNCSIILIHHDRKSSGRGESVDEMDEMRGSSDLANYADIILKLDRKGNSVVVKQLKNRNAEEEKPFKISTTFTENSEPIVQLKYEGEFLKQGKAEHFAEKIIIWIEENEITSFKTSQIRELALNDGVKKNNLHNALCLLQERGIIENKGRGDYNVKEV